MLDLANGIAILLPIREERDLANAVIVAEAYTQIAGRATSEPSELSGTFGLIGGVESQPSEIGGGKIRVRDIWLEASLESQPSQLTGYIRAKGIGGPVVSQPSGISGQFGISGQVSSQSSQLSGSIYMVKEFGGTVVSQPSQVSGSFYSVALRAKLVSQPSQLSGSMSLWDEDEWKVVSQPPQVSGSIYMHKLYEIELTSQPSVVRGSINPGIDLSYSDAILRHVRGQKR